MSIFLASIQILKKTNADLLGEILLDGQPAYDETNDVLVIGDGSTVFESLPKFRTTKYNVLSGLISQTGTSAPTLVILENTTGATPTLSYIDYGVFGITLTGLLLENKTWYNIRPNTNPSSGDPAYMLRASDDTIRVYANDDTLNKVPFEIRIYE